MKALVGMVVAVLVACGGGSEGQTDGGSVDAFRPTAGVDILFVIDNGSSIIEEQNNLIAAFPAFVSRLEQMNGGVRPSMHIAVTSTSVDVGSTAPPLERCASPANGAFITGTGASCPTGNFAIDLEDGTTNFTGTLDDAFACMAAIGTDGCVFRQPFEAMHRALDGSHGENAGFLRDDALLAIVLLSRHDDCSAADTRLFDNNAAELGPLLVYRCFANGVVCEPDDPSTPGSKTGCTSREDSTLVHSVGRYRDFLAQLKPNPGVVLLSLVGPPSPIIVDGAAPWPDGLEVSCQSASGTAYPAVRIDELTASAPLGINASSCDAIATGLNQLADLITGQF